MEVEAITGEVKYSLRVPHLSTYTGDDNLTTEFSLSMGGLRSRWQATIQPFLPAKPHKPHDMNSDVGITLTCLRSSIAFPHIDISCNVVGRGQAHEKKLEQVDEGTWQGVLVPRLALHVFDLLPQDTLTATLRFIVRSDDVWRFSDPLEDLSAELRDLQKGKYSDVTILTTDGVAIPAHSLILHARSDLLQGTPHEVNHSLDSLEEHMTPKTKRERPETPLDSTFGSDLLSLSGYHSLTASSLSSSSVSSPSESSLLGATVPSASPVVSSCTPRRRFTPTHSTGDKRNLSPCKFSSSKRLTPRVTSASPVPNNPTPRRLFTPIHSTGDKRILSPCKFSPSKHPVPRITPSSPRRRVLQRENETPRRSPAPPVSCQSVHSSTSACSPSSKAPLKEVEVNVPRSVGGHTLRLNMSASVARAMLDWIYTGECSELRRLAKPLLVGGTRHGVDGLVEACEQHLAAALTPAAAPHTLLLAHKYSADALLAATMKYAVTQAKEVTCQPSWATVATTAPALITEFSRLLAQHSHPGRKR